MSRSVFPLVLSLSLAGFAIPVMGAEESAPAKRPNIVFIISDDHRWDAVGAAGNSAIKTPHQDRLAREGVHFLQATMHVPQCSPARAQLLTGLPPHANGWLSNQCQRSDVAQPDGFAPYQLLPKLLRQAGYKTALAGKWHLDAEPWNCGFDQIGTWMPSGGGPYKDAKLAQGKSRATKETPGFVQQLFTDSALDFIRQAGGKEDPFFLWLAYTAPHTPLKPNPPHLKKLYSETPEEKLLPPGIPMTTKGKPKGKWNQYYEAISYLDEQVGRVLTTLDEQKLTSNTVVIFVGDNGYMMGQRGVSGKVVPYEASIRVPLMIRAPHLAKLTGPTDAAASSLDLSPTILKLAGVSPPKEWPGRDLTPVLQGRKDHGIEFAVTEFPDNQNTKFGDAGYFLVRTSKYKFIDWMTESKVDEFYDLKADPLEKTNLVEDEAVKGEREKLQAELSRWKKLTKADAPTTGTWVRNKR